MHGREPGFSHILITEVDSMGGVVDFGVGLDTKTSPCHAAIAKAQEQLRLEYDVREDRRRELEFLEKGGNPLDFKLGRASISLQSTSFTDQLVEHEAKGSFVVSVHGDSAESSGHPGVSGGPESNIADNLLLFGRGKFNLDGEKNTKRTGKRMSAIQLEKSSQIAVQRNSKDSGGSLVFRLGAKGQAYARRNRSRSNRDSQINKYASLASSSADLRDFTGSLDGVHAEEHAVSSMSNSKSNTQVKKPPKNPALEMEIDGEKIEYIGTENEKGGTYGTEARSSENLKVNECDAASVEQTAGSGQTQPSQLIGIDTPISFPSAFPEGIGNTSHSGHEVRANGCNAIGADSLHVYDMNGRKHVSNAISEMVGEKNIDVVPAQIRTIRPRIAVHDGSLALKTGVCLEKGSKEQPTDGGPLNTSIAMEGLQFAGSAHSVSIDKSISLPRNFSNSVVLVKEEKVLLSRNDANGEEKSVSNVGRMKDRKSENSINISGVVSSSALCLTDEPFSTVVKMVSSTVPERQSGETSQVNYTKKANEDAILRDARIIEANIKRAVAPSKKCLSTGKWHKCQWDFVLEEMAWMANDFMQERMWKTAAAAHVSQLIASFGRSKFEEEQTCRKQKNTARTLAKAVMQFWHSAKAIHSRGETTSGMVKDCAADLCDLSNTNNLDIMSDQGVENRGGYLLPGIQSYALRFLHFMSTNSHDPVLAEAPCTPKRIDDSIILDVSRDDELSGECLFYKVRPGAMQSYRESVESQWADYEKIGNIVYREECEASMCGSVADGSRESVFEDEAETQTGILPGAFENNFSFKITSKKKKLQQKACTQRLYGVGAHLYDYPDGKSVDHFTPIVGKRPSSTVNVGTAPTKRMRTAARQRTVNCFGTGVTGALQRTSRTDVSSGDTSSFQDDQCSLHGGSQPWNHLEVESTADFERRLPFDGIQMPRKSKKRRKSKHLGCKSSLNLSDSGALIVPGQAASYEQRLQADSMMRQDQRDLMKMRFESQSFESNQNPGFYGQHVAKKTKFMKHTHSHEQIALSGGPMPSPVASQMSNMSNSNKLIRIINGRDRGRKSKAMKVAAGFSGSGNAWSSFEDQALVVLVHDMGINWELVSDALNSALLFKCVYRKPKDCKERHKFLMDRSSGDGADSAEDSGSSQPYQSTLPGIPKGSARQLFQRLHGPMEEDTLKARFEKIISIGPRMSTCRSQSDIYDLKKITPAHNSHAFTISQAHPNNLSGTILSPLDLCDAVNTGSDVANLGYQGSHSNGITVSGHQGSLLLVHPTSTSSNMLQGSPGVVLGNGLPSPSPSVNTQPRDKRYAVPRSTALLVDDQQRLQNCNQIFPGSNIQQPCISVLAASGGVDRGVHMLHGSNGMGVVCGVNRSLPMQRPSFQGIGPTGILNMVSTNSMPSSNNVGMPNSIGVHSSVVSGPGHTTLRPRDALQMVQPGQSAEEQKQVMMQEIQLQASQGNAHSVTQYSGMNSPFSNAATSPVQTFPGQQHHTHQITQMVSNPHPSQLQGSNHSSTAQQAFIRFAKERQLQQKAMLPAQHPNSASTATSMQSNIHPQHQKQPNSTNSLSSSHKQQISTRNAQSNGAMAAQIMKQRQRLQVEQPRSMQLQPQPQAKHLKCVGRGSTLINPNIASDGSHFAGLQAAPKNQTCEKLAMQQSQGPFSSNAGLNPNVQHKNQHKLYSRPQSQSSKHGTVVPSVPHNNQSSIEAPPVHSIATSQQSVMSSKTLAAHQQQLQLRQANQSPPNMQRMAPQQDPLLKTDGQIQSSSEHVPQSSDSVSSPTLLPTGTQWKQDTLLERNISTPTVLLVGTSQENISGNSAVKVPARQFSVNLPTHGHGTGGQWLQQQQLLNSQSHPSPPQQQDQQGMQGNLYTRPLNAGLG